MGIPQDGYQGIGSLTPTSTTGAEVRTLGCESVAYTVLTATSSPQVKAYGADPGGTFIPVRYRLITVAGVESLIDPDTASGVLAAGDHVIVPNNGYDQIRISTTAGTMTANATRSFYGGVVYEMQKLIDGGITATSNTEYADDGTGFTLATSKVNAIGRIADLASPDSVDEGDIGIPAMTLDRYDLAACDLESGSIRISGVRATPKFAVIDAATSGDNTIVAAVASKKIRVLDGLLVSAGTVNARFESGASGTALTGQMNLVANSGFRIGSGGPWGQFETAAGALLNLELSGAISVDGWLTYIEV